MLSVVEACGQRPLRSYFDYAQHDTHFNLPNTHGENTDHRLNSVKLKYIT